MRVNLCMYFVLKVHFKKLGSKKFIYTIKTKSFRQAQLPNKLNSIKNLYNSFMQLKICDKQTSITDKYKLVAFVNK